MIGSIVAEIKAPQNATAIANIFHVCLRAPQKASSSDTRRWQIIANLIASKQRLRQKGGKIKYQNPANGQNIGFFKCPWSSSDPASMVPVIEIDNAAKIALRTLCRCSFALPRALSQYPAKFVQVAAKSQKVGTKRTK